MKKSILVIGNSDSGLYDFRKEVLEEFCGKATASMCPYRIQDMQRKSREWAVFIMKRRWSVAE